MPSPYITRERFLNRVSYFGKSWQFGAPQAEALWFATQDWESLTSRRNGFYSNSLSRDLGGDFTKVTYTERAWPELVDLHFGPLIDGHYGYNYVGPWGPTPAGPSAATHRTALATYGLSNAALTVQGTRFVAEASPTAPKAGVTTALYELKHEGLPSLSSKIVDGLVKTGPRVRRLKAPVKGSGSDYLNWQFGWLPIISDIRKLAASAMKADELLHQLYADSGKMVRRKRGNSEWMREISQIDLQGNTYGSPTMATGAYGSVQGAKYFSTVRVERSTWFSGAFLYHIPEQITTLGKLRSIASDARYLYGISLSPVDVWNLIPFSWLADWVVNAGDVISNISDQLYNKQVLKYGYTMAHTVRTTNTVLTAPMVNGAVYTPRLVSTYDIKQRMQATPFGFGLSWDGFTPYQLSILAALGLSRGR